MTREDLEQKAQEMMHVHNLEEIHVTTDGQGFTDKERAVSHSNLQKDKTVYHYQKRAKEQSVKTEAKVVDTERVALSEQYEKLFEKKPTYNMGLDKMRTAIQEKEAEIAKSKEVLDTPIEGSKSDTEEDQSGSEDSTEEEQISTAENVVTE